MCIRKPTYFTYPDDLSARNTKVSIREQHATLARPVSVGRNRDIAPPRSLGRYAPAVRLWRALRTHEQGKEALREDKVRPRRRRFSIGSALLPEFT